MSLTQDRGRFVADVSFERLPAAAVDVARIGFIDCVATMIAGAGDPAPQLLRKALRPAGGEATLYFSGERAPAAEGAGVHRPPPHAPPHCRVAASPRPPHTELGPPALA